MSYADAAGYRKSGDKRRNEGKDDDASINADLAAWSDVVDDFVRRGPAAFSPAAERTRTFYGRGGRFLYIDGALYDPSGNPARTITVTDEDGQAIEDFTVRWDDARKQVLRLAFPQARERSIYPYGRRDVWEEGKAYTVQAHYGWPDPAPPPGIVAAVIELTAIYRIQSERAYGEVTNQLDGESMGLSPDARRALMKLVKRWRVWRPDHRTS